VLTDELLALARERVTPGALAEGRPWQEGEQGQQDKEIEIDDERSNDDG
jgi:hypothetical protein